MEEYKVGDIFYDNETYSKIAKYCNENNLMIAEIDADNNGRRFQIQSIPKPSVKEENEIRIYELKQKLADTDYQAIKFAEGELSEQEYASMKEQRKRWRAEINQIEKSLN